MNKQITLVYGNGTQVVTVDLNTANPGQVGTDCVVSGQAVVTG